MGIHSSHFIFTEVIKSMILRSKDILKYLDDFPSGAPLLTLYGWAYA